MFRNCRTQSCNRAVVAPPVYSLKSRRRRFRKSFRLHRLRTETNPSNPDKISRKCRAHNNPICFGQNSRRLRARIFRANRLSPAAADSDLSAEQRAEKRTATAVRDGQRKPADSHSRNAFCIFFVSICVAAILSRFRSKR